MAKILALLFLVLLLGGCGRPQPEADQGGAETRLRVVSTVGMIDDVVAAVGRELVDSEALMGPGVDPHLYRPVPSDLAKLRQADIVLLGGLELEGRMNEAIQGLTTQGKTVVPVFERLPQSRLIRVKGTENQFDPHVWWDVQLWAEMPAIVADVLSQKRPEFAEEFRANAAKYREELLELDQQTERALREVPSGRRLLVSAHDAFHYFGVRYGLEVTAIQGVSTSTEASSAKIRELAQQLVQKKVPAVFFESSVPRRTVDALVEAAKTMGADIKVGEELFSDAMGEAGTPEGTYRGMVEHNVRAIVQALK